MNVIAPKFAVTLSVLALVCSSGCSTFTGPKGPQIPLSPQASVSVEVHPSGRKTQQKQLPVTQEMRLQDVIDASGAKFRRKNVYIVRTSPKNGQKHKMAADFDVASRKVSMATDYAIYPGDNVVIEEDNSSIVDRMMGGILGE